MSSEDGELVPLEVPEAGGLVLGRGEDAVARGREEGRGDLTFVLAEDGELVALKVPEAGGEMGRGEDAIARGREDGRGDGRAEDGELVPLEVPEAEIGRASCRERV